AVSDSILEKLVRVEYLFPAEHEVDRARQLGREDGQGFTLAVLFLEPLMQLLGPGVGTQERGGQFAEGPLQMRVADLLARVPVELTGRLALGLDQAAVGQEILHPGKARDVVYLVEHDQWDHQITARDRAQQGEGLAVMPLGTGADVTL